MELTCGTVNLIKNRLLILLNNIKMELHVMHLVENMAVVQLLYQRFVEV